MSTQLERMTQRVAEIIASKLIRPLRFVDEAIAFVPTPQLTQVQSIVVDWGADESILDSAALALAEALLRHGAFQCGDMPAIRLGETVAGCAFYRDSQAGLSVRGLELEEWMVSTLTGGPADVAEFRHVAQFDVLYGCK